MSQTKEAKEAEKVRKAQEKAAKDAAADQAGTQPSETGTETQKIKFLRTHPDYAYHCGETADLTAEHVTLLVEGKFAELVEAADPTDETE